MRRILLVLPLFCLPAAAERSDFIAARDALLEAYFDELDPDQRDRHFEALGAWDHQEVVGPVADIASRFGTYLAGLEGQMANLKKKLAPYEGRSALSMQESGLRNSYTRKLEKLEAEWARARRSSDLLVKTVGSYKDGRAVQTAISTYLKHPTWRVRELLAAAAAHWHALLKDTKTSRKLFAALKRLRADDEAGVRRAVARSLGSFHRPESFDLLKATLKDADWTVRFAAIKSLMGVGSSEAVDVLIQHLQKEEGRLQSDIIKWLRDATGFKFSFPEEWARWWKSVGGRLPARKPKEGEETAGGNRFKDEPQFYGIPIPSEHICFIIDVSGSMKKEVEQLKKKGPITGRPQKKEWEPAPGKTRIEVARNELKRAVTNLTPKKEFTVVFFNHAIKTWKDVPVKATPKSKHELREFVDKLAPSGATYTLGALRDAFTMAQVINKQGKTQKGGALIDTIFLLSDGGPTDNKQEEAKPMDPDKILEAVREWNRDAGIVIHAIAVDTEEVGTYFLKQLAAQNGGQFVERRG